MTTTTIKVPIELRDRINRDAKADGLSAAGLIERLLDEHERRLRMDRFGHAFRNTDDDYWDEFTEWDTSQTRTHDS